ncbi:MAG: hypothetical protein M3Q23_17605 [Actinomycetota bacterium]|nr:hypothetical protein [Actinomycetota bacterium]
MDDRTKRISELLHEAAETHHQVFRITDGDDPDWATWYSDWLVNLSELPDLLGVKPTRSELTHELVKADREFKGLGWEEQYATAILRHFSEA